MSRVYKRRRVLVSLILLLLFATPINTQTSSPVQSPALLEFVLMSCLSVCDNSSIRVYVDGRYVSEDEAWVKSKSGKLRKVTSKTEMQLERGEIAELESWAEQPDFQKSLTEYAKRVTDSPSYVAVTYRNGGREKKVMVANYSVQNAEEKAKIPPSVMRLLGWAYPTLFSEVQLSR